MTRIGAAAQAWSLLQRSSKRPEWPARHAGPATWTDSRRCLRNVGRGLPPPTRGESGDAVARPSTRGNEVSGHAVAANPRRRTLRVSSQRRRHHGRIETCTQSDIGVPETGSLSSAAGSASSGPTPRKEPARLGARALRSRRERGRARSRRASSWCWTSRPNDSPTRLNHRPPASGTPCAGADCSEVRPVLTVRQV